MTPCDALSERMPDVASGRSGWTTAEAAHLAACVACQREWALVQAARALGGSSRPAQPPEVLAAAVLARVTHARRIDARQRAARRILQWGGLAAAVVLFAVLLRRSDPVVTRPSAPEAAVAVGASTLELPLPELDDAQPAELQAVLDGLATPLGESSTLDNDLGDDVTPQDLERVLRAWEG